MKKVLIVFFALTFTASVQAQFNVHELGKKAVYFGIAMGVNMGDFKLIHTPLRPENDSVRSFKSTFGPGFNLGIICNYQFHKYFDLRFIPTLSSRIPNSIREM